VTAAATPALRAPRGRRVGRGTVALIGIVLVLVLTQRFAIPIGSQQIPFVFPLAVILIAVGLVTGALQIDAHRAALVLVIWVGVLVSTLLLIAAGTPPSFLSAANLVLLYAAAAVVGRPDLALARRVARAFTVVMLVFAAISIVQFLLQLVGLPDIDQVSRWIPERFLLTGFAPASPIAYGSDIARSTAVAFLEPSMLSMFLGAAALVAVWSGMNPLVVTLLLLGMVPTLAGTGLVLFVPGALLLFARPVRRRLVVLIPGVALALVVAFATPVGTLYLGRAVEAGNEGSSASLRSVLPYTTLLPATLDDPFAAAFGHGAGSSDQYLDGLHLQEVTRPVIPKVLYEYGLVTGGVILVALLALLLWAVSRRPWTAGIVIVFLFVNASLLVPVLVIFTFFWLQYLPEDDLELVRLRSRRSQGLGSRGATSTAMTRAVS
jgi:hypothetical protein